MIRRAVLTALSRAVASAEERVAHRSLPPLDPLLAWLARRRLTRALRFGWSQTTASGDDPVTDTVHALQVAFLHAAGQPTDAAALDRHVALAAYESVAALSLGPVAAARWVTPLVCLVVVAVGVGTTLLVTGPSADPTRGPIGRALTRSLTGWVVALDRWAPIHFRDELGPRLARHAETLETLRSETLAPAVVSAMGQPAASALGELMSATRALAAERSVPDGVPTRAAAFREALRETNARFASASLPYFLDGDWLIHRLGYVQTALFVFSVDARYRIEAGGGDQVTVVHLTRIDSLNWVRSLLGYTRKSMDVAVVLLDKIEEILVTWVGPSLDNGAQMPILDAAPRRSSWQTKVRVEAGKIVRQAFERVLPGDRAAMRDFGGLLKKRRLLFAKWRRKLEKRGIRLATPGTLAIDEALYDQLEALLPDFQVRELRDLQRSIGAESNQALFSRMKRRLARSVEGHEVQHRLDYARRGGLPLPEPLRVAMGADDATEPRVERANFELSAYLSEIGREPDLARLNLALLARHVFESGGAEWHAAVAILDGLAETLGLVVRTSRNNQVRRRLAADAFMALARVPEEDLVSAARELWRRWYGRELAALTRLSDPGPER